MGNNYSGSWGLVFLSPSKKVKRTVFSPFFTKTRPFLFIPHKKFPRTGFFAFFIKTKSCAYVKYNFLLISTSHISTVYVWVSWCQVMVELGNQQLPRYSTYIFKNEIHWAQRHKSWFIHSLMSHDWYIYLGFSPVEFNATNSQKQPVFVFFPIPRKH